MKRVICSQKILKSIRWQHETVVTCTKAVYLVRSCMAFFKSPTYNGNVLVVIIDAIPFETFPKTHSEKLNVYKHIIPVFSVTK